MTVPESPELVDGSAPGLVLTCEHASQALPNGWEWPEPDRWLIGTHWAYDLGIADVTRQLAAALRAPAVLSTFSRLLIDPNRPVGHPDLFRGSAEGQAVHLNADLSHEQQLRRRLALYEPYHQAIDRRLSDLPRAAILSMHSFTPVYEGDVRSLEIGVLFNEHEALAVSVARALAADGWTVALNEPYSGREGLMYAADRHAAVHRRAALELEVRNDLACDPARRTALVRSVAAAMARIAS